MSNLETCANKQCAGALLSFLSSMYAPDRCKQRKVDQAILKPKNKYRGWRFGLGVVPCEFSAADDHDGVSAVAAADADQCDSRLPFFYRRQQLVNLSLPPRVLLPWLVYPKKSDLMVYTMRNDSSRSSSLGALR